MDELLIDIKSWLATPFKVGGRLKNIAADCLGHIIGVLPHRLQKLPKEFYFGQYQSIRLEVALVKSFLDEAFGKDTEQSNIALGLFAFSNNHPHLGFVIMSAKPPVIIHSYYAAGGIVEHHLDPHFTSKLIKLYRV
jgi:hypothetical protein